MVRGLEVENFRSIPLLHDLCPMVRGMGVENFRSILFLPDLRPMAGAGGGEFHLDPIAFRIYKKVGNGDLVRKGLGGICAC